MALRKALIMYYYKCQTSMKDHGNFPRALPMVTCNASPTTHGSQDLRRGPIHMDAVQDGQEVGLFIMRNSLTLSLQKVQFPCLGVCKPPLARVGQSGAVC